MLSELNKLIVEANSMVDKRISVEEPTETAIYPDQDGFYEEDWYDGEDPSDEYWEDEDEDEDDDNYTYYNDDIDDYDDYDDEEGPWI